MKGIRFPGTSLKTLRDLPAVAKREVGYRLDLMQHGFNPVDWKPMKSVGRGVREIRLQHKGRYRVIYVASFEDRVYVLHAFMRKTQKAGKQVLDAARRAFREVDRQRS